MTRINYTERTKIFRDKHFVVDKLHFQGQTGEMCAKYFDPNLYSIVLLLTSVVVEQINKWAGLHKHSTKHMGWA